VNTKPGICFAVNTLSQFMVEPRQIHWKDAKHVLRYLKGTVHCGMSNAGDGKFLLHGFGDSDWARDASTRRSTSS